MANNHFPPPPPANTAMIAAMVERLVDMDPLLAPYRQALARRLANVINLKKKITKGEMTLPQFACGHEFFGLHYKNDHWVLRE